MLKLPILTDRRDRAATGAHARHARGPCHETIRGARELRWTPPKPKGHEIVRLGGGEEDAVAGDAARTR
jgi:hypothetical protein